MVDVDAAVNKVIQVTQTTWPGVAMAGVFEAEHIDTVPWSELTPPYAIISTDDVPGYDGALGQQWYRPTINIFRVDAVRGMSTGVRIYLRQLALAFWPAGTAIDPLGVAGVGQVMSVPRMSWSRRLEPNRAFIRDNVPMRGGMLALDVLLVEPE